MSQNTIEQTILRLIDQIQPFWDLLVVLTTLTGMVMIGVAVSRYAQGRHAAQDNKGSAALLFTGLILFNVMTFLDIFTMSLLGQQATASLSYQANESGITGTMITFAVIVVRLIGLYGFAKGIYLIYETSKRGEGLGKAFAHTFGGVVAVNITVFAQLLGASVGGTIDSLIDTML